MGEKEITICFDELNRLEIYCRCKVRVILDMNQENFMLPECCPSCNKEHPNEVKTALAAYQRFYRATASGDKDSFHFRVKAL